MRDAYHGYPGGRPVWPFDKIKKPAPAPGCWCLACKSAGRC